MAVFEPKWPLPCPEPEYRPQQSTNRFQFIVFVRTRFLGEISQSLSRRFRPGKGRHRRNSAGRLDYGNSPRPIVFCLEDESNPEKTLRRTLSSQEEFLRPAKPTRRILA